VIALCQRGAASCGACCGLYNRADHRRPAVRADLRRRTRALRGSPRTPEAFRAAGRAAAASDAAPLFPSVRVCPLLGFLDAGEAKVGCLAHPSVTGGVDLRDCGAYDASICEAFLCPSHAWLGEEEADLAAEACGDWYLYGLVVTDVPFLRACLDAIAAGAGARVERRHLAHRPFRSAFRGLLALKEELEPGSEGLFGAFRPGPEGGEVPRAIDYAAIGRTVSPFDAILTCVGADPRSGNDLDALEEVVRRRVGTCAAAWPPAA
jgi:hypothetical protein